MGIKGLTKLIGDYAPNAVKGTKFDSYFSRKVAVDASMHIYQFLVVVGRDGTQTLTNEAGEVTAHLQGMMTRTTRMLEAGIKPVFVFDGKAPEAKGQELAKRRERRGDAEAQLKEATEQGDQEKIEQMSKRTIRMTKTHNDECKRLLRLMGVPVHDAPGEAEAEGAALCAAGVVYAVATEDMDALTQGATRLTRHLFSPQTGKSSQGKPEVSEFTLSEVLSGLGLTMDQFIDLCILSGCDYAGTITRLGPVSALKLIKEHKSLDRILELIDRERFPVPDGYEEAVKEARRLFKEPDVTAKDSMPSFTWTNPDEEGMIQYMVKEKTFSEDRVRNIISRLKKARGKGKQNRLESFFGAPVSHKSTVGPKKDKPQGKKIGKFSAFAASKAKKKKGGKK
jgi:flap endonuclease-1|uniref:Flap endonuclease 1 n=1 Tax=Prasinoderma singulare TaxID=676789 RepID=A0A7S3B7B3_9VIRI|mmetsp:Transcript_11749/g.36330  ORF Transcript_11749/g.36330 Transcript_11749/m.36330 type:complete len:395 (+) Transcript_11749:139-1323(+)